MEKKKSSVFLLEDTTYDKENKMKRWLDILSGVLLMTGFLRCFYTIIADMPMSWMMFLIGNAAVILLAVRGRKPVWALGVRIGICAICLGIILFWGAGLVRALLYLMNQCITAWNAQFDQYNTLFALNSIRNQDRLALGMIVVLLGSILIVYLIRRHAVILLTAIIFGILFFTVLLGICQGSSGVLCVMGGWVLFWTQDTLSHQKGRKTIGGIIFISVFLIGMAVFTGNYRKSDSVDDWKEAILKNWDQFRFGEDTLPQGDLKEANRLIGDKERETLSISFEKAQEMYLRGFVGSTYESDKWEPLSEGAYVTENTSGMLDWLEEQQFSSVSQYMTYEENMQEMNPETSEYTVEITGAYRKYAYAPYEISVMADSSIQPVYDWQFREKGLFGTNQYSYRSGDAEITGELLVERNPDTEKSSQYMEAEKIYRTFVYDNYVTIDNDLKAELEEMFFSGSEWENSNVNQITTQIRIVLQELAQYSDTPFAYEGNEDFVMWFLTKAKQGNAAYFATAATMAYRAAGIPARYVEGYYLPASDADVLNEGSETSVSLTEDNAHAWVEIYRDGVGWLPVEVVPGFYYAQYTTQEVLDMPQSSVTVTNQEDQESLQGSTTDKLDTVQKQEEEKEDTPLKKTLRVVGILLLLAIIAEIIYLLMQLQYRLRMQWYEKKVDGNDYNQVIRVLYDRTMKILDIDKIPGDRNFPYERSTAVCENYETVDVRDYERFLSIVQKSRFSDSLVEKNEVHAAKAFVEKLTKDSRKNAGKRKQFLLKYWYAV